MEKRYLAMSMWLCKDTLQGKTADFRLPPVTSCVSDGARLKLLIQEKHTVVETIRPAQGFPFNILILKAKIHKDTIWGNIPIIFGALHNLLKAEKREITRTKLQGKENAKQVSWYLKGRSSCGKSESNLFRRPYTDRVKYMLTAWVEERQ